MKVLIVTGIFPPDIGGPATYSKLLLEELPKAGIEVDVLSFGEVRHLHKLVRHTIFLFKVLGRGKSVDIFYAQDPVSVGFPTLIASLILRKKFLLKVVGDYAWEQASSRYGEERTLDDFVRSGPYPFVVNVMRKVESFVARHADRVVTPSEYLKKIVMTWGIASHKVEVIYNSFDSHKNVVRKSEAKEALAFNRLTIVSSGRLVPWKGFKMLIGIIPELIHDFPDLLLVIVGDGPDREELEREAGRLRLYEHVIFTGNLPQGLLFDHIRAADVFALNTSYEGFSHLILEALSLETAIVTTPVGGNSEILQDGKNALLVGYNDRIAWKNSLGSILKDRKRRLELSVAGKEKVAFYSKERMLSGIIKTLNHL